MVLRRNDNTREIEVEYLPLVFLDQDKLNELIEMSKTDVSVLGFYDAVVNNGLGYLFESYNYCETVNGTYQSCCPINRSQILHNHFSKSGLVSQLRSRVTAFCLSEKYKECRNDPSIVAYSTRLIGWSCMNFTLNEELSISYNTNFGYGWANYFTAILSYKGIEILPYSMWVHYYNCNLSQIQRYTRVYQISNGEWRYALEFGREVYNSLVKDPSGFVNKWLVGEVDTMVEGLRSIFNNHNSVIPVNESNGSKRELRTKEDIVLYKGEKMSGALSFIDNIKTIETLNISMDSYIDSILELNRQMVPELQEVVDEYKIALAEKEKQRASLLEQITPLKEFVDYHVSDCAINFIGETDYSSECEARRVMEQISPAFNEKSASLKTLEDKDYELYRSIRHLSYIINTLTGYVDTINDATKKVYGSVA